MISDDQYGHIPLPYTALWGYRPKRGKVKAFFRTSDRFAKWSLGRQPGKEIPEKRNGGTPAQRVRFAVATRNDMFFSGTSAGY
jgi:hypothetical protein